MARSFGRVPVGTIVPDERMMRDDPRGTTELRSDSHRWRFDESSRFTQSPRPMLASGVGETVAEPRSDGRVLSGH